MSRGNVGTALAVPRSPAIRDAVPANVRGSQLGLTGLVVVEEAG
jgi:hypothetical protein